MFGMTTGKEMPAPEDKRTIEERLADIEKSIRALSGQLAAVAHIVKPGHSQPIQEATILRAIGYSDADIMKLTNQVQSFRGYNSPPSP